MPDGYPPTTFDAEEAADLVASVFGHERPSKRWDARFSPSTRATRSAGYCRHHFVPVERADTVELPLCLTKRGVLVRASKQE